MMADVEQIQIVVAHSERATLRLGDMFLKIDADQARTDVGFQAMVMAPVRNTSTTSSPATAPT